jgi:hypothetical protein
VAVKPLDEVYEAIPQEVESNPELKKYLDDQLRKQHDTYIHLIIDNFIN